MWLVTCDMLHVPCDMWHMTGGSRWTFSQNFSSLAFMVWELEVTCDTWYVTPDTWHVTPDIWHVSCDTKGVMNIVSKFQVPKEWMNEVINKLFLEQPRLHRVCLKLHLLFVFFCGRKIILREREGEREREVLWHDKVGPLLSNCMSTSHMLEVLSFHWVASALALTKPLLQSNM